jgi:hypothetical protein
MAHNVGSLIRHIYSLSVLRIASLSSVLPNTIFASCIVLLPWRVSRSAFSVSVGVVSLLDVFPVECISYIPHNTELELRSWDAICICRVKLLPLYRPALLLKPQAFSTIS